jgi:hypothetical protein
VGTCVGHALHLGVDGTNHLYCFCCMRNRMLIARLLCFVDSTSVRARLGLCSDENVWPRQRHRDQHLAAHRSRHNVGPSVWSRPRLVPQHRADLGEDGRLLVRGGARAEARLSAAGRHRVDHVRAQRRRLDGAGQEGRGERRRRARAQSLLSSRHGRERFVSLSCVCFCDDVPQNGKPRTARC